MAVWCNSFVIVPKPNGTAWLCLHHARLNQALIMPMHRGPTLNDRLPKLTNACYMTITDASSAYQNLKFNKKSSYLNTFPYQFDRNRYTRLLLWVTLAGDMLQWKIDEIFKDDRTLRHIMQIFHWENVKLNKNKCHFRCTKIQFIREVISREQKKPGQKKVCVLNEIPPNNKKELQSFLHIINS